MKHQVRSDERPGRRNTGYVIETRKNIIRDELVKWVILCIALVAQLERYGISVVVEEPLSKAEKRQCRKIGQ